MLDLIAAKRDGRTHSPEELSFIANAAAKGSAPDYQISAWLMAVCLRGMTEKETAELTRAMAASGARLDLSRVAKPKADKHSTGGVGDGISLALAPLVAACGVCVPMMSGRGLGHTGGTLDKLESIPGFQVRLSPETVVSQCESMGVCLFGQNESLAPADRKLYALRDATASVESLPLIVGSILSKKLCEGLDALVIDVKSGSGAIFKTAREAEVLGRALVKTAGFLGLRSAALLTAMEQPLGRYVGNALEVRQAVEILRGEKTAPDYLECLLALGGWMLHLSGLAKTPEAGAARVQAAIDNGEGFKRLKLIAREQGGDSAALDDLDRLPKASASRVVAAPRGGFIAALDARKVGRAAIFLGAGRDYAEQTLDYGAGLRLEKKVGDRVAAGETLAVLYSSDEARLRAGEAEFLSAVAVGPRRPRPSSVVRTVIQGRATTKR